MLLQHLGRKHICPELVVFAKTDLELDGIRPETVPRKHGHGVVEDVGSALDSLVEP
jgi:hypothetical protein